MGRPRRLTAHAGRWAQQLTGLSATERTAVVGLLERLPALFADRPVVLAHGDFAPVNALTDGMSLTGLVDFESVRLADPLFDVAWGAWAVSFAAPAVLESAWPLFLREAGLDASDPDARRMVADRPRAMLR